MNVNTVRSTPPAPVTGPLARPASKAVRPTEGAQTEPASPRDVLSGPEQEFFANAFPGAAADLRPPGVYQKDGVRNQAEIGRMIDRKG